MAKVLCVLLRRSGRRLPGLYARDERTEDRALPGGQTAPTPRAIDFTPGELVGSVSGELGLRAFL